MKRVGAGIRAARIGEVLRVEILGEIDHHTAATVREQIDEGMYTSRPKEVRLDLSDMRFMDSSGLGLIMGRFNTVKAIGGTLTVADPNEGIEKIMNLAGLERIVRIVHSNQRKSSPDITNRMKAVASARAVNSSSRGEHVPTKRKKSDHSKEKKDEKRKI